MVGSAVDVRVIGGNAGMVRGVEGRPEMVVVWVDLGTELGEVCWVLGALIPVKRMKKEKARFQWEEEGVVVLSALWIACSLSDDKRRGGRRRCEALTGAGMLRGALDLNFHRWELLLMGEERPARRLALNAPAGDPQREERRRMSCWLMGLRGKRELKF